ncbi:MAG: TraG family conjugative transposon ATPase [Bacteroidota bacterium]
MIEKNGAPVRLDLWDEPVKRGLIVNRNRLIFGPSGTGKSFLINHIASQYFEQGHHIVMIDIGNSYKKLCRLCKGQYFTYDVGEPLQFNPFYLGEEQITVEKKVFIISLMMFLWKGDDAYRREEKQILSMYVDAYYAMLKKDPSVFPCMSTFFEFVCETKALKEEAVYFDKLSFKLSLQDFHDGKFAEILNSRRPINLVKERFIVFEMDNIKDHPILFPLVTMLCIDVVMSKIRQVPSVKKSIFIDECWKPISKGEMAEFIKYLYKTVRKFYGEVAIATQDVEDILDTAAGPAMINNTDTMILLSHKKKMASKDKFAKYLSFGESDLEKLFSTDKREVYIKVGNVSNVYKVTVSPERYACYSSNADENKIIFQTYQENENMELALNEFVERNN